MGYEQRRYRLSQALTVFESDTHHPAGCQNLSQTYAVESAAFVLHCTAVITQAGVDVMQTAECPMFNRPGGGSSAVFAPDGRRLTEPLPDSQEGIIYADLDMDLILKSKCFVDSCGHYSRPDMLWLGVDDRERTHKAAVHENVGSLWNWNQAT